MDIRFAGTQDVPGIISLLQQVGQVHHQGRPDIFRSGCQKYTASQVTAMLNDPAAPIFVATEQERVLGYCFCVIKRYAQDPVMADYATLYIDDLCVDENCRSKGVGTALYERACEYARAQKCGSITLNVWCCNEKAMKFYEHLGLIPQKIGMEKML